MHTQDAHALFDAKLIKIGSFLRRVDRGLPFLRRDTVRLCENADEDGGGREARQGGDIGNLHLRLRLHESFGFGNAVPVDELIEGAVVGVVDEL